MPRLIPELSDRELSDRELGNVDYRPRNLRAIID